jgi:hypothetical protein
MTAIRKCCWCLWALSAARAFGEAPAVILDVPFVCQAPTGNWRDSRLQDGCEEAVLLMAHLYLTGGTLGPAAAEAALIALADWETAFDGNFYDRSLADTALLFAAYYGHAAPRLRYDVTAADLKGEVAQGRPVIVPTNGRLLANPHYTSPGPVTHMLLVIGYDDTAGVFITHDPGTRFGARFRYPYGRLMDALYDYPTGRHATYRKTAPVMGVVTPP